MKPYLIGLTSLLFSIKLMAAPVIAPSPEQVTPLLNGLSIPAVSLNRADGTKVSLPQQLQNKPAVLVFYRGGWCPYCNAQLSALREIEPDLAQSGYQLIAITPAQRITVKSGATGATVKRQKQQHFSAV